jgi:hypothetical protein
VRSQILQTRFDVLEPRVVSPVSLRGKVKDLYAIIFPYIRMAGANLAAITAALVVFEHGGIPRLELESQALTHHANAVHGVGEHLRGRLKDVVFNIGNHVDPGVLRK